VAPFLWLTVYNLERGAPTRCAQPFTQACLPCNDHAQPATPTSHHSVCQPRADHAQPAADKAPTSVTEFLDLLSAKHDLLVLLVELVE